MKKLIYLIIAITVLGLIVAGCNPVVPPAEQNELDKAKPTGCTTIQSGLLLNSDSEVITTGYDEWGYNYQAMMFNGYYCDSYRDAAWCQEYKDVELMMKWNDAWLSNKSCNGDLLLDRHFGYPSYIGSGAWLTNHQSGTYWSLVGDWVIEAYVGDLGSGPSYIHGMTITDDSFIGLDYYPLGNTNATGDITDGIVTGNNVEWTNKTKVGTYEAYIVGTIADDGTMSGTWEDNIGQEGTWISTTGAAISCDWNYFVKIVAVPSDATSDGVTWLDADGTEIGPVIWGAFAVVQEVSNDACAGLHGVQYKSPAGPGLGQYGPE